MEREVTALRASKGPYTISGPHDHRPSKFETSKADPSRAQEVDGRCRGVRGRGMAPVALPVNSPSGYCVECSAEHGSGRAVLSLHRTAAVESEAVQAKLPSRN